MTETSDRSNAYATVGVLGAGAWGTALALAAAHAGRQVTLWTRDAEVAHAIRAKRENSAYLPGIVLPSAVVVTEERAPAAECDVILDVVPAQRFRESLAGLPGGKPLVICAKGIEQATGKLLTEVLRDTVADAQCAVLSGPSFAADVARGLPTAVTIAAERMEIARKLQATLGHAAFRPYASDDPTGATLGGAAKNVYAIACGIVDGMGLGESARAAMIARSFAELSRLGQALGAKNETLMGLSGLGDLVLTATSISSRNFRFGRGLGQGRTPAELDMPGQPLAEGVATAPALVRRAQAEGVELPIAQAVAAVLDGRLPLDAALLGLMSRPLKPE
ncbi:MAG: NAD(P)-dependent glycerol-3-phosphate dehydrogenase [Alphaproteobacteria bacterium]|nr:NAD(P)-dependent glycerol-3-phosphate dehydrogenase [Alphaproteobacteria bacterium]MBV9692530.1 NAD(P)-dependent glycerol-3-phosphate dehydrogenase [Alphaproteobacteria bacterium]